MTEARKDEYFIDGFMIRHFKIFPADFDKENLFEEQKIFLMYLVGNIPAMDAWHTNVDYKNKKQDILSITSVDLQEEEITLAQIHGTDISELKRTRLIGEKKKRLAELDEKFGIAHKEEETDILAESGILSESAKPQPQDHQRLWEMLEGKGIVKNG